MGKLIPQAHGGAINRIQKGEICNPYGRPPKTLTGILKKLKEAGYERVTRAGVIEAYELLLTLDEGRLRTSISDKKQPMIVRIVGKAMLKKNGAEMLERMLDRAHGKPKQELEVMDKTSIERLEEQIKNLYDERREDAGTGLDIVP